VKRFLSYKHLWLVFLLFAMNVAFAESKQEKFSRQELFTKSITLPSNNIQADVIRVVFSPGYKSPLHTHEGPGPRYLVSGEVRVEDGSQGHVYKTGEVFWETGAEMTIENVGTSKAEIVIFQLTSSNASK